MKKIALYLLAATALSGCGGDDSGSDYESSNNINLSSGFYTGTTDEGEYLEGLVDDDSKMWFIYSEPGNSEPDNFLGVIKSDNTVVLDNSQFVAAGKNYSFDNRAYRNIIINGNYKTSKAITGTLVESGSRTINYNLGYEETVSAKKHTLSMINNKVYMSNSYVSGVNSSSSIMIKFTIDGNFTSSDSRGCNISGKLTPSASERYFLSNITFSGASCSLSGYKVGEVYTGISVVDGKNNDEILFISTDTSGDTSVVFI
jgi:hypothetical protein|tara:strand:+ start:263 stop:1036 length:774 start_codon:yes stop_codon:yes gene_type:complete